MRVRNSAGKFLRDGFFLAVCYLVGTAGPAWSFTAFVTNTNGDNSAGSLGDAMNQINSNGGGTIDFSGVAGGTITQTSVLPILSQAATLLGNNVTLTGGASEVLNLQNAVSMTQLTLAGSMSVSVSGSGSNLVLTGANTYGGGTTVASQGLVSVSADNNLGAVTSSLTLDNGTLKTTSSINFNTSRSLNLTVNGGAVDTQGQAVTWNGAVNWVPTSLLTVAGGGSFNFNTVDNSSGTIYDRNNIAVVGGSTLGLRTDSGGTEFLSDQLTLDNGTFLATGGSYFLDYQGTMTLGPGGGTLATAAATTLLWSGSIGGTGALTIAGPGEVELVTLGNPITMTYTGGTLIQNGSTVVLAENNAGQNFLGPGAVTLDGGNIVEEGPHLNITQNLDVTSNGGLLDVSRWTMNVNGVISGSGPLTITADNPPTDPNCYDCSGIVVLKNTNTTTGGFFVTGKTLLDITTDSNLGAAGVPITLNNGNIETRTNGVTINRDINLITEGGIEAEEKNDYLNGVISGNGFLLLKDSGYVYLTNAANSYTGGTYIQNFTIGVIGADSNLGAVSGPVSLKEGAIRVTANINFDPARTMYITDDGGFFDTNGFASTWNGAITGTGDFDTYSTTGNGSITLTQVETYGGHTNVADFILDGYGGPAPPGAGSTDLVLTLPGNLPFSTAVSIGWNGILDMGGLPQTFGSLEGVPTGLLAMGAGNLNVGNNGLSTDYEGTITGTGKITKVGTGILTLEGVNSYTGGTDIQTGGGLAVGDFASPGALILGPVTVEGGAFLDGQGTVAGSVTVMDNATLEVSIPSGALSITQLNESSLSDTSIHVLPTRNQSGRFNVGSADLSGALTVTADPGNYAVRYRYIVVDSAATLNGTFSSLSSSLAGFTPSLDYGTNAVTLTLLRDVVDFTPNAITPNQLAVAVLLNQSVTIASDPFADKFNEIYLLNASDQRTAFTQMGGSSYAPLAPILFQDGLINIDLVLDQLVDGTYSAPGKPAGPGAPASLTGPGSGFWVRQADHFGTYNGDAATDVTGYTVSSYGLVLGNDSSLDSLTRAGWLLGYNHMDLSSTDGGSSQTAVDSFRFGFYGDRPLGFLDLSLAGQLGVNQFNATRLIHLGTDVNEAQATFGGFQANGALRLAMPLKMGPGFSLRPFLGFEYGFVAIDGFSESTAGPLDLSISSQSYNSMRPEAGVEGSGKWKLDATTQLLPNFHVNVSREMSGLSPEIQAAFEGVPGKTVTQSGKTSADPTWVGAGGGFKLSFLGQFDVYTNYTGYFGGGQTSHAVNAGASFSFN